jgi:hypothetical protein
VFDNDPSVDGRLRAFDDAIRKLLVIGPSEDTAAAARWRLGSDWNRATPSRLEQDHGLIWRLPEAASIRIPKSQLPHFIASTFDLPDALVERPWLIPAVILSIAIVYILAAPRWLRLTGWLSAIVLFVWVVFHLTSRPTDAPRWLESLFWIEVLTLFTLILVSVVASRRWLRRVGYVLAVIAFVVTPLTYFADGRLSDLAIGPLPAGLPVNVVANLDVDAFMNAGWWAAGKRAWHIGTLIVELKNLPPGSSTTRLDELGSALDEVSRNRDHVMDRGHYFAVGLTEQEREALIKLLETL